MTRATRDEETTGVVPILVEQYRELSRSHREQGERIATVAAHLGTQTKSLDVISANMEMIRQHISVCPARTGYEPLFQTVRELRRRIEKSPSWAPSGPASISIIPKFAGGKGVSPIFQILAYLAAAIGAAAAGYLAQ